jgi:hypothetical protein
MVNRENGGVKPMTDDRSASALNDSPFTIHHSRLSGPQRIVSLTEGEPGFQEDALKRIFRRRTHGHGWPGRISTPGTVHARP